ncbi:hypothetical protein CAEBREN_01539 [Caenorhabditis brenneri]|uniref:Uncharacterized protein n=1 Tax=Caenorhabditis brenneri TaxID=135651 RepID=G0PNP7_CAEBE|nr:hypothetical protein CAEBREN_01539 [Caenorhabditis brenneri]
MLFIHYITKTHFKRNSGNFWVHIKVFMCVEIVLYFVDLFNMLFNFIVLIRARQFHFNFCCIQGWLFVLHFVDNIAILVMRILMITETIDGFFLCLTVCQRVSNSFRFKSNIHVDLLDSDECHNWMYFSMCTLFFLAVERCCATFFIQDYEINLRRSISVFLNVFLSLFGIGSCFVIIDKENTLYVIVILLVINGFALVLHFFLQWWNRKIYAGLHDTMFVTSYSLTQRFSVAENIKSLK